MVNHRADVKPILAYVYQEADVIAFDCMADVIAMFSSILHYQICILQWQMLLPGGRWNTTRVEAGRCYSQVADGIATVLCYF